MLKFVVTGGCGFIGSNLVDYLIDKGHEVVVVDNNRYSGNENKDAVYYYNDVTKIIHNSEDIFEGAAAVFHLAAEIYVQKSLEFPDLFKEVNEEGTENIIWYARKHGTKNFILSSTSAIYGNEYYERGSLESDPVDCLNAYSESKYNAENICKSYVDNFGMNVSVLRYFNVYGDRQHSSGQYAPAIGKFLKQSKSGEPVTVVGDGQQRRDFVNVKDVVEANYLAFKNNKDFNIYNIGSGENISILSLAEKISKDIQFIPHRDGECRQTLADVSKAKSVLGWEPKIMVGDYLNERV